MSDVFDAIGVAEWIGAGGTRPVNFIGVDLAPFEQDLSELSLVGCSFLGCNIAHATRGQAVELGATIIDAPSGLPFQTFPVTPYSVNDLYDRYDPADPNGSWAKSMDHKCFTWFMEAPSKPRRLTTAEIVFARLHDTMQEGALARFLDGARTGAGQRRPVVGFMGGHDADRTIATFRSIAQMARELCRDGYLILSGGGPGLMEAANLGAFLAPFPDELLDVVLSILNRAPRFSDPGWLATAFEARAAILGSWGDQAPDTSTNVGVPTWLYGHEPPNVFSTHISKLFFNSLREDGLVTVANGGIVFGKGNAGTVQEVFQDACQNYYRPAGGAPTPMALYERDFWTRRAEDGPDVKERKKPLWPLLDAISREKPSSDFSSHMIVHDDPQAILDLIRSSSPMAAKEEEPFAARLASSPFLKRHGYS